MEEPKKKMEGALDGFSPVSSTPVFWKSRKRSEQFLFSAAVVKKVDKAIDDKIDKSPEKHEEETNREVQQQQQQQQEESNTISVLSEKRKALFEPLVPIRDINGRRPSNESLLPPPDFESASYPKGWLVGKKRKLVNVDVVESMRKIAIGEMNRKDREIDGLNEQLEEDARCLEHLQLQLLEERSKRAEVERQNTMLQSQVSMLMNMLEENEPMEGENTEEP